MRLPRVVARAALIAALALIVVPGPAGSRVPTVPGTIDSSRFEPIDLGYRMATMATTTMDPSHASAGRLDFDAVLRERALAAGSSAPRPNVAVPDPRAITVASNPWHLDSNISWYGPGFYGNKTACGIELTEETVGIAHKTLPCGTNVAVRYGSTTIVVPVIDRGPYSGEAKWDLTAAAAQMLGFEHTDRVGAIRLDTPPAQPASK